MNFICSHPTEGITYPHFTGMSSKTEIDDIFSMI